jgi:NAD(P)-dependent dehydrogenase (short-subunit alcohol dehydrogenase family)
MTCMLGRSIRISYLQSVFNPDSMNKKILITGASGNLGSAVLNRFREEGFRIAAVDSPRSAGRIEESESIRSFPADLMDEARVEEMIDKVYTWLGSIGTGVFTVGGFAMGSLTDTSAESFEQMYRLNFLTAYNVARQLFLRMADTGEGGHMVFIGSRPSLHPDQAKNMIAYALSKSLVLRLAEVLNEEGKEHGIIASVVIPSIIDTPQNREAMPGADTSKWVNPGEIADNIYYLLTPSGSKLREPVLKVYGDS